MKLTVTLDLEIENPSSSLVEKLLRLQIEHSTLTMVEHVVTQSGSVPSNAIRVAEVSVDGQPIEEL